MGDIVLLSLLGGGALIVILFFVVYRDAEVSKKLQMFEKAIEMQNNYIFKLKKEFNSSNDDEYIQKVMENKYEDLKDYIHISKGEVEHRFKDENLYLEERISKIEETLSDLKMPSYNSSVDENRVLSLHKSGWNAEDIARELRVNLSEVSFILKINT